MPSKGTEPTDLSVVDRFDGGVGWIAHPDETIQRASHAVVSDGELWIFDPVDAEGVDELLSAYGEVGGVVLLLDRHWRDAASIAIRHDVSVYVPAWMDGIAGASNAPVERFDDELAGFAVERLIDVPFWQEAVVFDGETLVVPEALGTATYYCAPGERLGVHPMLRPLPPWSLREYDADRLLVGHGEGIFDDVPRVIRESIENARRKSVSLYLKTLREIAGL